MGLWGEGACDGFPENGSNQSAALDIVTREEHIWGQ